MATASLNSKTNDSVSIDHSRIPNHIAIIMDGNGRWAKQKGKFRIWGHQTGVTSVKEITEYCAELGVKFLTLYVFSTENWHRPKVEVDALMNLLVNTIKKELPTLQKNNIRLTSIGIKENLPHDCATTLDEAIEATKQNNGMSLILALSYSAQLDMVQAVKQIALKVKNGELAETDITQITISQHLSTNGIPDPELLIRTSGECRISNFLLWEIAYSELYFTPVLWPDFRKKELEDALLSFQNRERRFGKTSEQIK